LKKIKLLLLIFLLALLAGGVFAQPGSPPSGSGTPVGGGSGGGSGGSGTGSGGFSIPIDGGAFFLLLIGCGIALGYNTYLSSRKQTN